MIEEPRLLDRLRDRIRLKHYSIRTEKAYLDWNRRFILPSSCIGEKISKG